jgi:hypothetical protein
MSEFVGPVWDRGMMESKLAAVTRVKSGMAKH